MRLLVTAAMAAILAGACSPSYNHADHVLDIALPLMRGGLCDEFHDALMMHGPIERDPRLEGECATEDAAARVVLTEDGGSSEDYLRRETLKAGEPKQGIAGDVWFLLYDGNWWMTSDQRAYLEAAQEVLGGTLTTNRRLYLAGR